MSQGADGAAGRPGVPLPIRVHDLLLGFAGRLDDDALADARQFLASAELDRALEFLAGCLVAGRIAISGAQRQELASLFTQVYLDAAMIDRLMVDDGAASNAVVRHRFGGGPVDGESAVHGVAEAARRVLDVLPDVRSVWAVWRLTPAGPVSGPVPHRVVLVGVGPAGFAPATSYRLENSLRRAGIRASVEVLRDGAEAPEYHHAAMQYAAQVPFARQAPTNPPPVRPRSNPMEPSAPPSSPSSQIPTVSTPVSVLPGSPISRPAPPPTAPSPPVAKVPEIPVAPPMPPLPEIAPPGRRSRPEPPADPLASANPPVRPAPVLPASWMSEPASTTPKPPPTNGKAARPESLPADDSLSDQEKLLLRQLQEELARREQEESDGPGHLGDINGGRHGGGPATFDWPTSNGAPTVINGIPPQHPDQPR
ncbi:MAG TPA: hypothetical protein VGX25_24070 [Actinophytocola sp.]|uniref:hypothetical protein n=1 Tax=Actinophytocola sp. TaxID=1872138 RepID=UPI002DDCBAAB|nr:hypothetical protein [Actinophytocola sp.]HEV2782482.1 hypothetical protein [Actinophytocola sp.]